MDVKTKKMRKLLFTPLKFKKDLHSWIKLFFGLDLPDCIVDFDSNSTPMDAIWDAYEECQKEEKDRKFTRMLCYAARESAKTLSQSIFECLCLLHLKKNVVHYAAIEQQSDKAQGYIREFFSKPYLRDFMAANNKKEFEIIRYLNIKTGDYLNQKEFKKLNTVEKNNYKEQSNKTIVITATLKATNGQHAPIVCADEIELIDNPIVNEEVKMIPEVRDGKSPLTYMTSSRKFAGGVVQKEIDKAETSGLAIKHWNIIDFGEACPKERHRPDLPKLKVFRSNETLRTLTEEKYLDLSDKDKENYIEDIAFDGCISNCQLFAFCKGALATRQQGTSSMLKPISRITSLFNEVDPSVAKAQLLCWKPSSEGMIYPRLDKNIHFKTSSEIAEMVTGNKYNSLFSKKELIDLLKSLDDSRFYAGMDFGHTHKFAVTLGCAWGSKIFILEAFQEPELELNQQIDLCNMRIKHYNPIIYPDMAEPQFIKTFRRYFQMRDWSKKGGTVLGGIEIMRQKIMSSLGTPEIFFLKDDPGVLELFNSLLDYRWKVDPQGNLTDEPRKIGDDGPDSIRYMVMNVFSARNRVAMASNDNYLYENNQLKSDDWMKKLIDEAIGDGSNEENGQFPNTGKKGKVGWSF